MMRKQFINQGTRTSATEPPQWIDLEHLARVELTSEAPTFPIESALNPNIGPGWRAGQAGPQVVRLVFDAPQRIRCVHLEFQETERERTQEFALRWSADGGRSYSEVLRQQYNFGPPNNVREVEEYAVELDGVTALELDIVPDISRGGATASLERLMLG